MAFTSIEWLAIIIILAAVIKIVVMALDPKTWTKFAKKIWSKPRIMQWVALALSVVVFFILILAEISITLILAVMLFTILFMAVAIAPEAEDLIKKYEAMAKKGNLWSQYWLYIILWAIMLFLGVKELLA